MKRTSVLAALSAAMIATAGAAAAQPNLQPAFNVKTGKLTVKNAGGADAGRSIATVGCATGAPGGCPTPPAAAVAPYENPAYPNVAAVKAGPIKAHKKAWHTLAFFGGLVWAPGTYVLTVCVDAGDHVAESSEGDNCRRYRKGVPR